MPEDMGHEDGVTSAAVMGDRVCTGGGDQKLLLWRGEAMPQAPQGDARQPSGGLALVQDNQVDFPGAVTALLHHSASKWLFCGLSTGQISGFRQEPLAEATMQGHTAAVSSLKIHEAALLSGSLDGSARVWRFNEADSSFACAAVVQCLLGPVFALHVQPPGSLWFGAQGGIQCTSAETLQCVGKVESAERVVELLPYQNSVVAAFANGVVKVFDGAGKEEFCHGPLGEHTTNTAAAILRHPHAGKDILLCGQELGYVTAYDIPEFRPRGTFNTGYDGDVTAVVDVAPAEGIFATCGQAGDVVLWRWVPA